MEHDSDSPKKPLAGAVDRQEVEQRLRESQRFLHTLIGNLPGMVYRCRTNALWTSEFVSEGCFELTGYPASEFTHTRRVTWDRIIHAEDRERVRIEARRLIEHNAPFQLTYRIVTAGGAEKHIVDRCRPIHDMSGEAIALEGFIADTTERVLAERQMRETDARYRLLAENIKDLVCLHALDGRFLYLSSSCEALLGFRPEELTMTAPYKLFHPEDRERVRTSHARLLTGETGFTTECRMRRKSGGYVWIEMMSQTVRDQRGKIVQLQTCSRDITERKAAEAERMELLAREQAARHEAEQANRAKDEFVQMISHEFRTPLTTIKTLTRVMQHDGDTEAERREYLETIAAECDRQIDMVLNLLDLSRIEEGAFDLRRERVDTAEVLRSCGRVERHAAQARGQDFRTEIEPGTPAVRGDGKALRRALCAIIENAIKYTPDRGRITLSAQRNTRPVAEAAVAAAGGAPYAPRGVNSPGAVAGKTPVRTADGGRLEEVAIHITDTGRGIRSEDLPHIFEKFYRGRAPGPPDGRADGMLDDARGRAATSGVGLGLYLARRIIEALGGRIEAESVPPHGSRFTVYLPAWSGGRAEGFVDEHPGLAAEETHG